MRQHYRFNSVCSTDTDKGIVHYIWEWSSQLSSIYVIFYTFCIFRGKKIIHQLLWRKESGRNFMPDAFNVSATAWLKLSFPIWENENNRYVTNENNKMQDPYKSHPLALLILSKHSWNQHLRMLDYPMRKVYSMWRRFNESRR